VTGTSLGDRGVFYPSLPTSSKGTLLWVGGWFFLEPPFAAGEIAPGAGISGGAWKRKKARRFRLTSDSFGFSFCRVLRAFRG